MNKEEFKKIATFNEDGSVEFLIEFDFNEIFSDTFGIDFLNEKIDEFIDDGYLLMDLKYSPFGVTEDKCGWIIQVNADASEYLNNNED